MTLRNPDSFFEATRREKPCGGSLRSTEDLFLPELRPDQIHVTAVNTQERRLCFATESLETI